MKTTPEVIPEAGPADLPAPEETDDLRPRRRGFGLAIVASALGGAVVGGAVVFLALWTPASSPTGGAMPAPEALQPSSQPAVAPSADWAQSLEGAKRLVAAGKLREAQEEYLAILLIEPTHEEAMQGLVRVVGLRAGSNRAVLVRQAEAYRRAIALGVETEEHYTAPAMELLARAALQAAGSRASAASPSAASAPPAARPDPRSARRPREQPAPRTRPAPEPRTPRPASSPEPRAPRPAPPPAPAPRPAPEPPPAQATSPAQPAPPPPAALNVNEPFMTVVIGPVASSDQASAITGELTIAGYAARLRRQATGSYVITLGPYRRSEAARAAGYVRSRFGQGVPVSLAPAP